MLIISVVSQKGGVGKSTITRALAREFLMNDWSVKIADLDTNQGTCFEWTTRRMKNGFTPEVDVQLYTSITKAIEQSNSYDLLLFDGAPSSSKQTLDVSKKSALIVLPTGTSLDDMPPTIRLANEMVKKGIDKSKIIIVLCRTSESDRDTQEAKEYLESTPYKLADSSIQEKPSIKQAIDLGKTCTETKYSTINEKCDKVIQSILNYFQSVIS